MKKVISVFLIIVCLVCVYTYPNSPVITFKRTLYFFQTLEAPPSITGGYTFNSFVDGLQATAYIIAYPVRLAVYTVSTFVKLIRFLGMYDVLNGPSSISGVGGGEGWRGGR